MLTRVTGDMTIMFNVLQVSGKARAGELITPHGAVPTPVFMPVASQATVKTLTPDEVEGMGFRMVLSNTYHLYLRPGIDVIERLGGLHRFMGWNGAILTDSGGYQIFSLAPLRRLTEEGVVFRSHIDGSQHLITPELAGRYQAALGADIIMALDECAAYGESIEALRSAMARTHAWAARGKVAAQRDDQALFAIVQGGVFPELRRESVEYLTGLDLPGYAIGGLSIGEPKKLTLEMVEYTAGLLPPDKPRYLMGVGAPEDIVEGVALGIDMFDSALPTRVARNGALFTPAGRINIRNAAYREQAAPIDPACGCYTCRTFSAAYLHHLFNARELLAYRLATLHNLTFISDLVGKIRGAITDGTFEAFRSSFLSGYRTTNEQLRIEQKAKWLRRKSAADS